MDDFCELVLDYKKNRYIKKEYINDLICFKHNNRINYYKQATSTDIYNFFVFGELVDNIFFKEDGKYVSLVYRTKIKEVINAINNGYRLIFLHSNLGNGKTIFLQILKQRLYSRDFHVYDFIDEKNGRVQSEIEKIVQNKGKKIIIIENYFNYLNIIKYFSLYNCSDITFVLTARTMIYDTKIPDVNSFFESEAGLSVCIDINSLNHNELLQLYQIIEQNQLWGNYSSKTKKEKIKLLSDKKHGNKELQTILLDIINSTDIKKRVTSIIKKIKEKSGVYYDNIVMNLLSQVMSLGLNVNDINSIVGVNCLTDTQYLKNEAIREIISVDNNGVLTNKIKTSVLAREILRQIDDDKEIIYALEKIADYANRYSETTKYDGILQTIVSFSHVRTFLNNKNDSIHFVIDYYDTLKGISYYTDNSFFWLQYSIACLHYKEFGLSQKYVETAYGKFRKSDYNIPFQCDNQQAKIYLELIKQGKSEDVEKDFLSAHNLIMKPNISIKDREENTIRLLNTYIDHYFEKNIEKAGILPLYKKCCGEAHNKVNAYLKKLRNERDRSRYEKLKNKLLKKAV